MMSCGRGVTSENGTSSFDVAHLVHTVSHCGRHLRRALAEHVSCHELSDTEFLLLWSCGQTANDGISQTELAQIVGVSPAQLSGLIDRLSVRRLVSTQRCQEDRRRQYVKLSSAGLDLLEKALIGLNALALRIDSQIPATQYQKAIQLLTRIAGAVHEAPALRVVGSQVADSETQEKRA